jgi:hypothetical protein
MHKTNAYKLLVQKPKEKRQLKGRRMDRGTNCEDVH